MDAFKRMCNVGESNESSAQMKKTIREMPNWLRPTAGFGIGLQSIFLVADRFEIDTSTGQEAFHAVVHSRREGGYLQLQRASSVMPRGTTIRIRTNVINDVTYSIGREIDRYLQRYLDPLDPENHVHEVHALEIIHRVCGISMFPLHVTCQEQSIGDFHSSENWRKFYSDAWSTWNDRYRYHIAEDGGKLFLWDTREAVHVEFQFNGYGIDLYFKGIKVDKQSFPTSRRIHSIIDLYGLDTRQTITLDRESLTKEGNQRVYELYNQYLEVFKEIFLKKLEDKDGQVPKQFNLYTLWLCCNNQQRKRITAVQEIKNQVYIIAKNGSGVYEKQIKPIGEIISNSKNQWYIDTDEFLVSENEQEIYDFEEICTILNMHVEGAEPLYIADWELEVNERNSHWMDQVRVVDESGHKSFICYTLKEEQGVIQVPETQKGLFLRGLGETILDRNYVRYERQKAKRYAIPALGGYEAIAVKKIRNSIMGYPYKLKAAWIVSPFTREDLEAYEKLKPGKEAFAKQILNAKSFSWVVDWVQKYHLGDAVPGKAEIFSCYKKLIYAYCEALEKKEA